MRYNHFDMLPEEAFKRSPSGSIKPQGGGSSGGGSTSQQNYYSSVSPWAAPYVNSMLGAAQNQVFQSQPVAAVPAQYDANGNLVPGTGTPATTQITGMNPYTQFGLNGAGMTSADMAAAQAAVAPFSNLQNQSFQSAANLQTPGQFGTATNLATQAGQGALASAPIAYGYGAQGQTSGLQGQQLGITGGGQYGAMGAQAGAFNSGLSNVYGQQGANIGASLGQMSTNPNAVGAYMNPYIQNALNPALQLSNQQFGIQGAGLAGQATSSGAFGGTRNALVQGLNQQNQMLANNQLIGTAYNQAYTNAQNQMNAANQAALAGNAQALTGAQQAGNLGIAGANAGLAGVNTQLAGTAQGMQGAQVGLQGVNAAQQGYNIAGNQATNLANIGTADLAAQQAIINQQNQLGQQQTAGQQAIINQAMQNYATGQQYPWTQLSNLKSLSTGLPIADTTSTLQQAAPSAANVLGGAGMAGLGIMAAGNNQPNINFYNTGTNPGTSSGQKEGGITKLKRTKKMASGGIADVADKINSYALNNPSKVPDQSTKDGVLAQPSAQLVQAMKANAEMQDRTPPAMPNSTVIQDIDARQQQQQAQEQGIDAQRLQQELPTIMADLKVRRDIAEEKGNKKEVKQIDMMMQQVLARAEQLQSQGMQPQAMQQGPMSAPAPQGIAAMQQAQPQTQAQPQGIASAAGGGIIAFKEGGEVQKYGEQDSTNQTTVDNSSTSPFGRWWDKNVAPAWNEGIKNAQTLQQWERGDPTRPGFDKDWIAAGPLGVFVNQTDEERAAAQRRVNPEMVLDAQGNLQIKPNLPPAPSSPLLEDESQRGAVTPEQKAFNAKVAGSGNYEPIIIHGGKTAGVGAPKTQAAPAVANMDMFDVNKSTNNITNMVDNFSKMLLGQMNQDNTMKNISNALIAGGARMAASKSPYGYAALGEGIGGAGEAYIAGQQADEARRDKVLGQLMSLGLTGQQLQMEAQKLGISQAELRAKMPLYAAQAHYYLNRQTGAGGMTAGSIGSESLFKRMDKYNELASNPKADPAFFASLPKDVQDALKASPDTASHQRGLDAVKNITQQRLQNDISAARILGAKKVPVSTLSSADED